MAALLVLCSCATAGASHTPNPPASQPPAPTAPPTASPPTATATVKPTTALPTPTDSEQLAPPLGELTLPDGSLVPGVQGSWCYDGACADIIPPDKEDMPRIDVSGGMEIVFMLAETHRFAYWTVGYAPDDDSITRLAQGGAYVDPDMVPASSPPELDTFTFRAPPAGDWVLAVDLQFAGGSGDTVYYWHAVVE